MRKGGLLLRTWSHSFSQSGLASTSVMAVDSRLQACTSMPPGPADRVHSCIVSAKPAELGAASI